MSGSLRVRAFAKVNLGLRILGVRSDGYHELATIFQTIALHDTLTFAPGAADFRINCTTPGVPLDRSNLVWRAADALWRGAGREEPLPGLRVDLEKRVPPASGLGGGSADAAATLVALDALWELKTPESRLRELAAALGADVAFFLSGGAALGRGRGEELTPLPDLPDWPVVVARPAFGVSTPAAYRWFDEDGTAATEPLQIPNDAAEWAACLDGCVNDLEAPVARRHPEIGGLVTQLRRSGSRLAAMSGSGSAVFGLFTSLPAAAAAASGLAAETVAVTRVLPGAEYRASFRPW